MIKQGGENMQFIVNLIISVMGGFIANLISDFLERF